MKRKLLALFLTLCLVLPLFPAVTLAEGEVVATYELVTEAPEDWSGRYLIVYEDPTNGCFAMDSSLSTLDATENYRSLLNEGNTIIVSNADNDVYFTISKNGTGYSIASKNGKYMNQSSNANGLQTVSKPGDPLSIALNEDGSVDIVGAEGAHLRFNSLPDQMRFRFYKSSSYQDQKSILLYKLTDGIVIPDPTATPEPTEEPTPEPSLEPTPEPTPTPEPIRMYLKRTLNDGDSVVIYNPASSALMGFEEHEFGTQKELNSISAQVQTDESGRPYLSVPYSAAVLKVEVSGDTAFRLEDGRYLYMDETNVLFKERPDTQEGDTSEPIEKTKFNVIPSDDDADGYFIESKLYTNRRLEYYMTYFTSFKYNNKPDQFLMHFYAVDGEGPSPTATPTPTPEATPTPEPTPTPEAGEDHVFKLVTNEEDLAAGGTYLIANSNKAGSGKVASKQTNNNRSAFDVVVTDDQTIVLNDSAIANEKGVDLAYTFILGGETNIWTFYDEATGGYLYAASSSSNYLRTETELDDNGTFVIEISAEGVAAITAQGDKTRNRIQYNAQSDIFSCYSENSSQQQPVYLYKLVEEEAPTEKPKFGNCSVVLSGQIGMNFYMNLPDAYKDGTMEFTVGDRTATAAGVKQDDGRYKFTCYLTSVEMAEQITAVYTYEIDGVSESVNKIISVQGYLGTMIANADNDPEFAKASALAKALWNYGYYAQLAVADGKNHPPMANDYIGDANLPSSISGFDVAASLDNAMIVSATYSLTLDTETALNIYLTPAEGVALTKKNVSVAATGADVEYAVEPVGSRYRVRITGIAAHELGTKITITAGTSTVTASALSYVQKCLANENAKPEAKNAAAALYRYYQETIQYMEEDRQ